MSNQLSETKKVALRVEVKILLEISDNTFDPEDVTQNPLIDKIITNVYKHLQGMLKLMDKTITEVPEELDYIIEEIAVRRYNRIGTEGMKSESVEGHSVTFYDLDEEFNPYLVIIEGYQPDEKATQYMGRVRLF